MQRWRGRQREREREGWMGRGEEGRRENWQDDSESEGGGEGGGEGIDPNAPTKAWNDRTFTGSYCFYYTRRSRRVYVRGSITPLH
jgi:hypothetical protein